MSKTEILSELPKLTPAERFEIRVKLAELDGDRCLDDDDPLTDEQKALLDARLADTEAHPEKSIPWEEVKKRLEARFRSDLPSGNVRTPLLTSKKLRIGTTNANLD